MLAIFFVLASVGVAGCVDEKDESANLINEAIGGDGFYQAHTHILVDSETSVMYLYIAQQGGRAMTVLLNSDGTPKLYDPQTYTGKVSFF